MYSLATDYAREKNIRAKEDAIAKNTHSNSVQTYMIYTHTTLINTSRDRENNEKCDSYAEKKILHLLSLHFLVIVWLLVYFDKIINN